MTTLKTVMLGLAVAGVIAGGAARADEVRADTTSAHAVTQTHVLQPVAKVKRKGSAFAAYTNLDETGEAAIAGAGGLAIGVGACFAAGCGGNKSPAS